MKFGEWCNRQAVKPDKTALLSIGTDGLGRSANLMAVCLLDADTLTLTRHFITGADAGAVVGITGIPVDQYDAERKACEDVQKLLKEHMSLRPFVVTYAYKFAAPFLGGNFPGVFPCNRLLDIQRLGSRIAQGQVQSFSEFSSWGHLCAWSQTKLAEDTPPLKLDELFRLASGTTEDQLFGEGIPQLYLRPRQLAVIWAWMQA